MSAAFDRYYRYRDKARNPLRLSPDKLENGILLRKDLHALFDAALEGSAVRLPLPPVSNLIEAGAMKLYNLGGAVRQPADAFVEAPSALIGPEDPERGIGEARANELIDYMLQEPLSDALANNGRIKVDRADIRRRIGGVFVRPGDHVANPTTMSSRVATQTRCPLASSAITLRRRSARASRSPTTPEMTSGASSPS